jgi:hypothetical protein
LQGLLHDLAQDMRSFGGQLVNDEVLGVSIKSVHEAGASPEQCQRSLPAACQQGSLVGLAREAAKDDVVVGWQTAKRGLLRAPAMLKR